MDSTIYILIMIIIFEKFNLSYMFGFFNFYIDLLFILFGRKSTREASGSQNVRDNLEGHGRGGSCDCN